MARGCELLRASTVRIFLQFDAALPTYSLDRTISRVTNGVYSSRSDSIYAPSFSLSLGLGFGRSRVIKVQRVD